MIKRFLTLLLVVLAFSSNAQQRMVDSLVTLADTSSSTIVKINEYNMASWYYYTNHFELDSAIFYAEKSIQLNSAGYFPRSLCNSNYYLGIMWSMKGDMDKALFHLDQSLRIAQKTDHQDLIIASASALGNYYQEFGDYTKAIDFQKIAYESAYALSDTNGMVITALSMAQAMTSAGMYEESSFQLKHAEDLLALQPNPRFNTTIALAKSRNLQFEKRFDEALVELDLYLKAAGDRPFAPDLAVYHEGMSVCHYYTENYTEALVHGKDALKIVRDNGIGNSEIRVLQMVYSAYEKLGQMDSAYFYQEEYYKLKDSIMSIESQESVTAIEAQYEVEKNQKDLALAELELKEQEEINQKNDQEMNQLILILALAGAGILALVILYVQRRRSAQALEEKNGIIEKSLEEKEVLLGEIHHRVKNNLQLVSTMLELQSKHDQDEKFGELVRESCSRIQTMSLIHQVLYQYDDLSGIEMDNYIRNLIEKLHVAYSSGEVETVFDIDKLKIGIDTAIPLALVINEIYTNSLKYAFDDKGKVEISLQDKADHLELRISDNGKGFEKENVNENFGSKLIKSFSRQLDATVEIISNLGQGTSTLIKINRFERVA